jgi:hypothetical protein
MQKKHFNKLAIASAILGIISIMLWISIRIFPGWLHDFRILEFDYFQVILFILFIALVSGDLSLIIIARSKGTKHGIVFAVIGIMPLPLIYLDYLIEYILRLV